MTDKHTMLVPVTPGTSSSINRRRFIMRSAAVAGTAVAASTFFGACGIGPGQSGPVTITIMEKEITENTGLSKKWLTDFQKNNQNIKISRLDFDKNRLSSMLAAGNPPDLVATPGGPEIVNLAARGVAKDLSEYFSSSDLLKDSDLMPVCDLYRWDGKQQGKGAIYGMPHDWSVDSMYWINTELFKTAGVPVPSIEKPLTFEEMLDLGKRVTQREGEKIKVYGFGHNWDWIGMILTQLEQDGASLYKGGDLSKLDFKQPAMKKIFEYAVRYVQAHVGDTALDPGGDWNGALYTANRYAMIAWGYWFGSFVAQSNKELRKTSALLPTPQWGSKRVASCYGGTGFWIPNNSKQPDEAWKFFEWYNGGAPAEFRAEVNYGISPLKHFFENSKFPTEEEKIAYETQKKELDNYKTLQFTPYVASDAISTLIDKHLLPVMRDQAELDKALADLDHEINALAQQGKEQIDG